MQDFVSEYLNPVFNVLNYNIFALGDAKITPLSIFYVVFFTVLLIYLSQKINNILIGRLLKRTQLDIGAQTANENEG